MLAVYLCSGSLTSLEFKLLLSVTVPVRWGGVIHPITCIHTCLTTLRCLLPASGWAHPSLTTMMWAAAALLLTVVEPMDDVMLRRWC